MEPILIVNLSAPITLPTQHQLAGGVTFPPTITGFAHFVVWRRTVEPDGYDAQFTWRSRITRDRELNANWLRYAPTDPQLVWVNRKPWDELNAWLLDRGFADEVAHSSAVLALQAA